jgi:hypothetical protein
MIDFHLLSVCPALCPGLRKVYPYYFTFTTFTKGRWVGEKILDVFAREFRAHPVEEYVSDSARILLDPFTFLDCFDYRPSHATVAP